MRAQTTEAQEWPQPTGLGWIQDGPLEEEVLREGAGSPLYTKNMAKRDPHDSLARWVECPHL